MKSSRLKGTAVVAIATVGIALGALGACSTTNGSEWALAGSWSDTCSCMVACPCFFGSEPTEHHCEGTSLLEIEKGHYGGVEIDGLVAMTSMRIGQWTRIYVTDTATPEQVRAVGAVVPLALPFLAAGELESVQAVPISVERTPTTVKYESPESSVEIEMVVGANGEPMTIANQPRKGLPFPEINDQTQYISVLSKHDSEHHDFEWVGRNGFVSTIDRSGTIPRDDDDGAGG